MREDSADGKVASQAAFLTRTSRGGPELAAVPVPLSATSPEAGILWHSLRKASRSYQLRHQRRAGTRDSRSPLPCTSPPQALRGQARPACSELASRPLFDLLRPHGGVSWPGSSGSFFLSRAPHPPLYSDPDRRRVGSSVQGRKRGEKYPPSSGIATHDTGRGRDRNRHRAESRLP
jgi:hypothetical protein